MSMTAWKAIYRSKYIYRKKFRRQTSDNMDRWKAEMERVREKRKSRREKSRREKSRRKKIQVREKVGKSQNTVFFQWCVAPEGRKVGSLKRRVRSQLARWEMKNCSPLWRDAHVEVKMYKTPQPRTAFGSWDVEKVHAVVARSTFRSQNVQNTPLSDRFWKLRCRKSARRCGAKHISKSKCIKHTIVGPLLEVEMSKKCTPLWCEAHVEVKMYKTHHCRTAFGSWDVEKVHAVVARSTSRSQHLKNTRGSDHFWTFRCRFAWQARGIVQLATSEQNVEVLSIFDYNHHYITLQYTPLHYTDSITFNYTTLPYIALHSTTLHYTTLPSTTLHYITLHYATLHYTITTTTQLHYTTFQYTPYTTLHYTTLHYTTLNYTPLHYTTFHYTSLHYTTLLSTTLQLQVQLHNYTPLHSITLHYTTLPHTTFHYTTLHDLPLHFTTLQTLHPTTLQLQLHNYTTTLHYTTLNYTTLHYTTLHSATLHTLHYITLHYITLNDTAPQVGR